MSAFVVSDRHVDVLVWAASKPWYGSPFSVYVKRSERPTGVDVIYPANDQDGTGSLLLRENQLSVGHRYSEPAGVVEYAYRDPARGGAAPTAVEVLKAVECYRYQSCEHPGWESSDAKAIADAVFDVWVSRLPGYDEAPWGWEEAA